MREGQPLKNFKIFSKRGSDWLRSIKLDSIQQYLKILDRLDEKIGLVSRGLDRHSFNDDFKLLMTTPGVGLYSALMIKAEIGDVGRFPDSKHLCSYAGLAPSKRSSAGRSGRGGR